MSDEFKSMKSIEMAAKKNKGNGKDIKELIVNTLIMLAIALVAGGVLGFVHELTKEPIAAMAAKEKQAANRKVFLSASDFSDSILDKSADISEFKALYPGVDITDCIEALDESGAVAGYVLEVTSHEGYGGDIVFSAGITTDGTLNGIFITSISETAGLGMRAPEVLVPQFIAQNVEVFEVVKGTGTTDAQIDAISGATITSKAVTNGVNAALEYFRLYLNGGEGHES